MQFFFESNDLTHPLEYAVNPVDEIVNIYPELDYLNDLLLQEDYDKFINVSFKILDKYNAKCNPDNKKLLLLTNKCDGKFGNNYTHGGYKCGNNGYWTEECVASYCDIGYIFDYNSNKCKIDICSDEIIDPDEKIEPTPPESSSNNKKNIIIIILSVIIGILIIIIIILIFLLIKNKNSRKTFGVNSVENMDLANEMIAQEKI